MVLESLISPEKARKKPWEALVVALIYSMVAVLLSTALFPEQSSILTIGMITILFIPFIYHLFKKEEKKDELIAEKRLKPTNLFQRHKDVIIIYSMIFIGITIALTIAFIFMPSQGKVFELQIAQPTLSQYVDSGASGMASNTTYLFIKYVLNNSRVMILAFILSALLGTGAIFVLSWNASVISVFVGLRAINPLIAAGTNPLMAFAIGLPTGLMSIALHGIPEILSYFLAGIAGGILSVGILREKIASTEFREIFKDAVSILIAAEVIIIIAATLEAVF